MPGPKPRPLFYRIPEGMMTTILLAGFNRGQLRVLNDVLYQVFGPAKSIKVALSTTDIARRHGMTRRYAWVAIRQLMRAGVLRRDDYLSHEFVEDWRSWDRKPSKTRRSGGDG